MSIQAIFCDIDGTLYDHSKGKSEFPQSAKDALRAAQKQGIKVFVATGRYPDMLEKIKKDFPFDGFVTVNGQYAFLNDGTVIRCAAHDKDDIRKLIPIMRERGIQSQIIEEHETFPIIESERNLSMYDWMGKEVPPLYDVSRVDEHPVLQFIVFLPMEEGKQVLADLQHIEVTSAGGDILDVIPKTGGKEVGINAVAEYFGFARENIMTFGDGINDVRMLRWAGIGVAMGNAAPEAKAAADYITTPVWENGIANALKHFGVGETVQEV